MLWSTDVDHTPERRLKKFYLTRFRVKEYKFCEEKFGTSLHNVEQMQIIKSVKTSLDILSCFTNGTPKIGVIEISRKLGLSKSTVSRILSTLERGNFVAKGATDQKYRLGSKVLELASIFISTIEWRTIAIPYLKDLRDKTDETVMVFVIDEDKRILLEKFESSHELRPFLNIGGRYPLHAGSAGKLLLAYLPKDKQKEVILKTGLPRYTPNTIRNFKSLEKELTKIRKKGIAVSHQERVPFLSSISAPIRDFKGEVIAALCVDGPTVRFTFEKVKEFISLAVETADRISREIGFKYRRETNRKRN